MLLSDSFLHPSPPPTLGPQTGAAEASRQERQRQLSAFPQGGTEFPGASAQTLGNIPLDTTGHQGDWERKHPSREKALAMVISLTKPARFATT